MASHTLFLEKKTSKEKSKNSQIREGSREKEIQSVLSFFKSKEGEENLMDRLNEVSQFIDQQTQRRLTKEYNKESQL